MARAELDRRPQLPARISRAAQRLARRARAGARRGHAREAQDEPVARLRQPPAEAGAGAARARDGAEDRRVALRGVPDALRRGPALPGRVRRLVPPDPDARPRPRLLHAHDVRVHGRGARRAALARRRRPLRLPDRGDRRPADSGRRDRERDRAPRPLAPGAGERGAGSSCRRLLRGRGRRGAGRRPRRARRPAPLGPRGRHRLRGTLAQGPAHAGRPRRRARRP